MRKTTIPEMRPMTKKASMSPSPVVRAKVMASVRRVMQMKRRSPKAPKGTTVGQVHEL
jgi:hypothetical protein